MFRSFLFAVALVCSAPFLHAQDATPTPAPTEPPPVVKVSETDAIKALAGKLATVEGKISRVGTTTGGGITFINFAGSGTGGFVAVVFKSNYTAFSDGFDKYKAQTVRVTGPIAIFKETTPQIVVKSPDQIKIIEVAAEATPTPKSE